MIYFFKNVFQIVKRTVNRAKLCRKNKRNTKKKLIKYTHVTFIHRFIFLKNRQEGKPKIQILCNKCKYVTVGCFFRVQHCIQHHEIFINKLLIWETIQQNQNDCYYFCNKDAWVVSLSKNLNPNNNIISRFPQDNWSWKTPGMYITNSVK